LYYSTKFIAFESSLFIWLSSSAIALLIETHYYHVNYSQNETSLVVGTVLGSLLILRPPILGLSKAKLPQENPLAGYLIAIVSSLAAALVIMTFKRLKECHYVTLNHIFSMIIVLFLPIFFPMQGLYRPGVAEWLVMIGYGFVGLIAFSLYVRAFQIGRSGKLQATMSLLLVALLVFEVVFKHKSVDLAAICGAVLILLCVVNIFKEETNSGELEENNNQSNYDNKEVQMSTFSKSANNRREEI
jgi:drug/metabolite transporter (DMT)-like permease